MSRWKSWAAGAVVVGAILGPAAWNDLKDPNAGQGDIGTKLEAEAKRLGLQVVVPVHGQKGEISYERPKRVATYFAVDLLADELARYSPVSVRTMQLEKIVLCSELRSGTQAAAGVADPSHHTLYYDSGIPIAGKQFVRAVVNHEIGHLIDYEADTWQYEDRQWSACNAPGWRYLPMSKDAVAGRVTSEFEGVPNSYAGTSPYEDRAEVFGLLMSDPEAMVRQCRRDPYLTRKALLMQERVRALGPLPRDWPDLSPLE